MRRRKGNAGGSILKDGVILKSGVILKGKEIEKSSTIWSRLKSERQ